MVGTPATLRADARQLGVASHDWRASAQLRGRPGRPTLVTCTVLDCARAQCRVPGRDGRRGHAICGENGIGTSTIMRMLSGVYSTRPPLTVIKGNAAEILSDTPCSERSSPSESGGQGVPHSPWTPAGHDCTASHRKALTHDSTRSVDGRRQGVPGHRQLLRPSVSTPPSATPWSSAVTVQERPSLVRATQ
jgi:hypothetical protein